MEASGSIESTSRASGAVSLQRQFPWLRTVVITVSVSSGGLLSAFSALVAFRRLWGGLQSAPTLPALLVVGVLLAVLAAVAHGGARLLCGKQASVYRVTQVFLPLSLGVAVFSICVPGVSFLGVTSVVLILGCEELFWLLRLDPARGFYSQHPSDPPMVRGREETNFPMVQQEAADFPTEVLRRIERFKGPAGEDICAGQIRSEFLPGQRTSAMHLEFCPPFQRIPVLHVEQVDGPDATVKTTQILPYGARLEVRLNQSGAEHIETRIEFSAIVENDDDT